MCATLFPGIDLKTIMAHWNAVVPSVKVRKLTAERQSLLKRALKARIAPEEIMEAITWYSKRPWNREKGHWKRFDNFMRVSYLTTTIEEMQSETDQASHRRQAAKSPIRKLAETAIKSPERDAIDVASETLQKMDEGPKRELLIQAARELDGKSMARMVRGAGRRHLIRAQALQILIGRQQSTAQSG